MTASFKILTALHLFGTKRLCILCICQSTETNFPITKEQSEETLVCNYCLKAQFCDFTYK